MGNKLNRRRNNMLFLRLLYMVCAYIVCMPLIVVIEVIVFGYLLYHTKNLGVTASAWWRYLRDGVKMNIDFVKNGL